MNRSLSSFLPSSWLSSSPSPPVPLSSTARYVKLLFFSISSLSEQLLFLSSLFPFPYFASWISWLFFPPLSLYPPYLLHQKLWKTLLFSPSFAHNLANKVGTERGNRGKEIFYIRTGGGEREGRRRGGMNVDQLVQSRAWKKRGKRNVNWLLREGQRKEEFWRTSGHFWSFWKFMSKLMLNDRQEAQPP